MEHPNEDGMDVEYSQNAEEATNDDIDDSDADSDDSDEEQEEQFMLERRVVEIRKELSRSPNSYDLHVELITSLRKLGELDQIRHAREAMHSIYPLTEELWRDWIQDEIKLAATDDDREKIDSLYQRATKDYLNIHLWLEYIQFGLAGMSTGGEEGLKKIRSVAEEAIRHGGLHVAKGALLWDSYRDIEMIIYQSTKCDDEEKNAANAKRITQLYNRQLAVPLLDMESTWDEYNEWLSSNNLEVEEQVKSAYEKAKSQLEKLAPLEDKLTIAETAEEKALVYRTCVDIEKNDFKDPTRIQALYERIVADIPLYDAFWTDYSNYVDHELKAADATMDIFNRAIRNCPWRGSIWSEYIYAAERFQKEAGFISSLVEKAFSAGLGSAADYKAVWLAFIEYVVRNCKWDDEEKVSQVREAFTRATDHLAQSFGSDGDPECAIFQYWAYIEAKKLNNLAKAREIWGSIIGLGHSKSAQWWLAYIQFERAYDNDVNFVRKLFGKSLHAVPSNDWPESIAQQWLQFEREEGDLQTMETARLKCKTRLEKVQEEREKQALEQPATNKAQKRPKDEEKQDSKAPATKKQKVFNVETDNAGNAKKKQPNKTVTETTAGPKPVAIRQAPEDPSLQPRTVFISNLDFKVTEEKVREVMSSSGTITDVRLVGDFKGRSKGFCYVEFSKEEEAREALKRDRELLDGRPMFVQPSADKEHKQHAFKYSTTLEKKKIFVKGLSRDATKEAVAEFFSHHGVVKDVRLVTYKSGAPKGLAYVEFEDEVSAKIAVQKTDEAEFMGQKLSVAISQPPPRADKHIPGRFDNESTSLGSATRARKSQVSLVPTAVIRQTNASTSAPPSQPAKSNADFRAMLLNKK